MSKEIEGAVEWRPQWEGVERERFEALLSSYSSEITLMRAVRKALGLSQVEVAKILETTQSNVSKLETRGDPSLTVLRRMAAAKGGKLKLTLIPAKGEELAFTL